jgi:hypothetical protein
MDHREPDKKIVFLLFHKSHFTQILPLIKKYPPRSVVIIPLDVDSLRIVKESGYRFIYPRYRDKSLIRSKLLRRMALIINEWGQACIKKIELKEYFKIEDFDLWSILKNEIGIVLFDKLYFLELVKKMLIRSNAVYLILPRSPSTISISYLTTVECRTIIHLARFMGMSVIS